MENPVTPEKAAAKPARKPWLKNELIGRDALLIAVAVLLSGVIVSLTILWTSTPMLPGKMMLENDQEAAEGPEAALPEDTNVTASMDDDPVLGNKESAKVAIIEFSDFECPFCKRFHDETYDQLVEAYVTTGKALMVSRDFPLSFHDPKATESAGYAECVGAEKGDEAYFSFSKGLYTNTLTNGKGLPAGKLNELIRTAGANPTTVTKCATAEATAAEIQKDLADGQAAGISGTPSFVIGKINEDGTVSGVRVVGALPYSGFQAVIDKYLE